MRPLTRPNALTDRSALHRIETQPVPRQRLFPVSAAAKYLGISDDSLRKYSDLGKIPVYKNPLNGHRIFKIEDLNCLVDELPLWNDSPRDTRAGRT